MDINEWLVLAMFASFVILLFSGFPVAWVLAGVGILFAAIGFLADSYLDAATGLDYLTLGLLVRRIYGVMSNWVLIALPMFVFMGLMLDRSGAAERLMLSLQRLFGATRGGLGVVVVLIGVLLAASTGIIGASVVLLGIISVPLMLRQGYNTPFALGTVASAGTLGILIPPSIMLVVMGDQLGLSVGDLFMGALIPGLLLASLFIAFILIAARLKPDLAPLQRDAAGPADPATPDDTLCWRDLLVDLAIPLGLMVTVLGSIFFGLATVTEASGLGALGALLIALSRGQLSFRALHEVSLGTLRTSSNIMAIIVGASIFALVLRELGGDELIESTLEGLGLSPLAFIAFVLLVVFLLGFFLDWIEISLIVLPLVAPLVGALDLAVEGFGELDEPVLIWFTVLVAVTLQTSFLTPPVGFALFYLNSATPAEIPIRAIYRGVWPFVLLQLIALAVLFSFPSLITWLPAHAYG